MPTHVHLTDYYEVFVATRLPNGRELALCVWNVGVESVNRFKQMRGITVLESTEGIEDIDC